MSRPARSGITNCRQQGDAWTVSRCATTGSCLLMAASWLHLKDASLDAADLVAQLGDERL
jgi:hypothetical protein